MTKKTWLIIGGVTLLFLLGVVFVGVNIFHALMRW